MTSCRADTDTGLAQVGRRDEWGTQDAGWLILKTLFGNSASSYHPRRHPVAFLCPRALRGCIKWLLIVNEDTFSLQTRLHINFNNCDYIFIVALSEEESMMCYWVWKCSYRHIDYFRAVITVTSPEPPSQPWAPSHDSGAIRSYQPGFTWGQLLIHCFLEVLKISSYIPLDDPHDLIKLNTLAIQYLT